MKHLLIAFLLFIPTVAMAQTVLPQKTIVLSAPLVEELFQRLSVTGVVGMLQNEVQHQPPPVTCPPDVKPMQAPPETIPPEPK